MFNFNFDLSALADWYDSGGPAQLAKELEAMAAIATVAAVNSPAVVNAPANAAPSKAEVQATVSQVIQAAAPVVAPNVPQTFVSKLEPIIAETVVSNPVVRASAAGDTIPASVTNQIASTISTTFKSDAQKDAELNAAIQQVASTPVVDEQTQRAAMRQPLPASPGTVPMPSTQMMPSGPATAPITTTPTTSDLVYRGGATVEPLQPAKGNEGIVNLPYKPEPENVRDPITGLTPAQVEAQKALAEAVAAANALGIKTVANTATAGNVPTVSVVESGATPEPQNFTGRGIEKDPLKVNGKLFTGNRNGIEYKDGVAVDATRADILQADREAAQAAEAAERAKNPLYNFQARPTAPQADDNYIYYYSWIGGVNSGQWELYRAPNTEENRAKYGSRGIGGATQATPDSAVGANALQNQPTVTPTGVIQNPGAGNTVPGPGTGAIPAPGTTTTTTTPVTATTTSSVTTAVTTTPVTAVTTPTTTATTAITTPTTTVTTPTTTPTPTPTAADYQRESAIKILQDRFAKYGLSSLAGKIRDLAVEGATEATITLQLQETPEYQMRFRANQERLKAGLTVLTPAEYLNLEDGYRQVLRAYGLRQFDNDAYVQQFIANDVSPAELSNRVVTAVQRVQNADPAITRTLRDFYGIGSGDLVAYVLDPQQQFQKIERQVAAAEIGAAARLQGIQTGVATAEQLAAQGITQAEARRGYSTIADILPTAEKLSSIYAGTEQAYGLAEAEQEVFNSLAEAQRRRTRLTQRELAQFGGTSGVSRVGLTQPRAGQFQNPQRVDQHRQAYKTGSESQPIAPNRTEAHELTIYRRVEVAMSNNYWDDEDDDLDNEPQLDGSDLLKKLRKAKRADEKRIKELTEQLETFTKAQREQTVRQVLEKKGVNAKAARLIMKDLEDVNEETVSSWLDDNADLFGLKTAESNEINADIATLRQQDAFTSNAVTPDRAGDFEMKLQNASSADEILSLLRQQG